MASQHEHVRAVDTVPTLLPRLRLVDAGRHRDPQVALEDEASLMRELRRMNVGMLLETTVAYALTMMRSRTWTLGEASDWCKRRARETRAAGLTPGMGLAGPTPSMQERRRRRRMQADQAERRLAEHEASRTGMVAYRLGREGYPECPDCGESLGHAEDCQIQEVWG